jgi:signal transduction histidine kinase
MERMNILLVDDRKENLLALESLLMRDDVQFQRASSGVEALELLLKYDFVLAMIDVQMPDMDGLELAEFMRGANETRSIPIIFVTAGIRDRINTFKGYEKGAVDYLYKPLDPIVVKSKVRVFLELAKQRQLLEAQLMETQRVLKERDEALKETKEALRTRDEFMSIASHELKTPLTSLHLQHQIINRSLKKRFDFTAEKKNSDQPQPFLDKLAHSLQICERQSSKLSRLLDELLDLTRVRLGKLELKKEEVNLSKIVKETLANFHGEIENNKYHVELEAPDSLFGNWDLSRVEQVVTNLLSNALKYGEQKPIRVLVTTNMAGDRARLIVKDQGMGVSYDLQEKIFKRFERAVPGNNISGLGLGLYITRQIVEAHGGTISVMSQLKQGSTFTVDLPIGLSNETELKVPDSRKNS